MPLSDPAPRRGIHHRDITCRGYLRDDGLWDVEAHLVDTKTYPFENRHRGTVAPGVPVHNMWLRLTLDAELNVHAVEAVTDHGPFHICGDIAPNFQRLVGLNVGPGFLRNARQRVGGVEGCTHLVELLGPLATTAFQTIYPYRERHDRQKALSKGRPGFIDQCHALSAHGPVVREHWPEFYTGPDAAPEPVASK